MIGLIDGSFSYSLLLGILAAVNPCGFVLLPTYLVAYLSVDDATDAVTRLRRSLSVGLSVSSGFIIVFLVVGVISRVFTDWIELNAKYAAIVVGIGLIVLGVRMLTGWRPRLWVPSLAGESGRRGSLAMLSFGVVYAVASIGCTIGLLTTAIFGSFTRHGFISGVLSVALYGLGMGLFVTALTTALAFAKQSLLRASRMLMTVVSHVSSGLVLLTGVYLTWYWYVAITEHPDAGPLVTTLGGWQTNIVSRISNLGATVVTLACVATIGGALIIALRRGHVGTSR